MSFGKKGNGEGHPARNLLPPKPAEEAGEAPVARMQVANPGGIDKGFIALAAGVVIVSAGAAMAAPSVLEMLAGAPVRPIEQVVDGLGRDAAKTALAREAFPDADGRAFMASLQENFPKDHDVLLGALADRALDGGDREDLIKELNVWSMDFAPEHFEAIGRTGNEGFDAMMTIFTDALDVVEKETRHCTLTSMERYLYDPEALAELAKYGSDGYKVGMRSTRTLIDLAQKGAKKPAIDTDLTPDDMTALQTTFFSLMMDEQVMGLLQMSTMRDPNSQLQAAYDLKDNFNICQLGRTIVVKLKKLPHPTKARLLAAITSNIDMDNLGFGGFSGMSGMSGSSLGSPMLGPPPFPSNWEPPGWDN